MSLLKQVITRTRQIDEKNRTKLNTGNYKSRKYKVEVIYNSAVYAKKSKSSYLLELYYYILANIMQKKKISKSLH